MGLTLSDLLIAITLLVIAIFSVCNLSFSSHCSLLGKVGLFCAGPILIIVDVFTILRIINIKKKTTEKLIVEKLKALKTNKIAFENTKAETIVCTGRLIENQLTLLEHRVF